MLLPNIHVVPSKENAKRSLVCSHYALWVLSKRIPPSNCPCPKTAVLVYGFAISHGLLIHVLVKLAQGRLVRSGLVLSEAPL